MPGSVLHAPRFVLAFIAHSAIAWAAIAQCGPQWLPAPTVPAPNGTVRAITMWDPDGPGPQSPRPLIAGQFTSAGGTTVNNIAVWNGSTWSSLGTGLTGAQSGLVTSVSALAVLPDGELVAGGSFATAGGVPAANIAKWNGTTWSTLGPGFIISNGGLGGVRALLVLPSGDLIAGGEIDTAGGSPMFNIARWNGSTWSALGAGVTNGNFPPAVFALAQANNGDVIAAGQFWLAGTVATNHIARWNGAAWSAMGAGADAFITALAVLPNGDIVAGGDFSTISGVFANRVARWNGTAWNPMGLGLSSTVRAFSIDAAGRLVAAGFFTSTAAYVGRWNGTSSWSSLGTGLNSSAYCLASTPQGDVLVGGSFTSAGGRPSTSVARWVETAAPRSLLDPVPTSVVADGTATFSAAPLPGLAELGALTFEWRRNGVPISDGVGGASVSGGVVSGASGTTTTSHLLTLTIAGVQGSDAGEFSLGLVTSCGNTATVSATLFVRTCGSSDFNHDGDVGTDADIEAFFACLSGFCCAACDSADFDGNGDIGTDADIEGFFRVLAGGPC